MKLTWRIEGESLVANTRSGFFATIRLSTPPVFAWDATLSLDGTILHTSEERSIRAAKRAIKKAIKRAIEMRPGNYR